MWRLMWLSFLSKNILQSTIYLCKMTVEIKQWHAANAAASEAGLRTDFRSSEPVYYEQSSVVQEVA